MSTSSPPNEHERQIHTFLAYLTLAATLLTISCTLSLILSQYKRASRYFSTRQGAQRRRLVTLFLGLAVACFFVVMALKYVDAESRAEVVDTLAGRFGEDDVKDVIKDGGSGEDGASHGEWRKRFWYGHGDEQDVDVQVGEGDEENFARDLDDDHLVQVEDGEEGNVALDEHKDGGLRKRWLGDGDGDRGDFEQVEVPSATLGRTYIAVKKQPKQTWLSQWLTDKLPFDFEPLIDAGNMLAEWLPPFQSPADYWWSSEYYWGAMIWFFFLSYETRLRALPWYTPILLTLLSGYVSLSGSQCLLYALMLMSPICDKRLDRWTPYQASLLVPLWLHAAAWGLLPSTSAWAGTSLVVSATGLVVYLALTATTWIHPRRLGSYRSTAAAARRSRAFTFTLMALPLVVIRIYAVAQTLLQAGSERHSKTWDDLWNFKPQEATEEGIGDLKYAARSTFGMLADTGRANAMAWDVVLSVVVIALWAALAEAKPRTMFRCTLIPWLRDESEVAYERLGRTIRLDQDKKGFLAAVKQLASVTNLTRFARPNEAPTTATAEAYVRKRGRPPKHRKSESANENGYAIIRSLNKSRSPGRPRYSASPKRVPSRARSQSRARSRVRYGEHGDHGVGYLGFAVAEWKAAGVTWCLAALGGLGVAVIGAFGTEVTEFV